MLTDVREPGPPLSLIRTSGRIRRTSATLSAPSLAISSAVITLTEAGVVDGSCGRLPATSTSGSSNVGGAGGGSGVAGGGWVWAGRPVTRMKVRARSGASSFQDTDRAEMPRDSRAMGPSLRLRCHAQKKPAPERGTGTTAALNRQRTFPSAEGHRTRSAGQVSWLRILAAHRLPGHPSGDLESSSPLQWRDRAGIAAPRGSAGRAPDFPFTPGETGSTQPTRYEVWFRV